MDILSSILLVIVGLGISVLVASICGILFLKSLYDFISDETISKQLKKNSICYKFDKETEKQIKMLIGGNR